jgi:hypothetical protein
MRQGLIVDAARRPQVAFDQVHSWQPRTIPSTTQSHQPVSVCMSPSEPAKDRSRLDYTWKNSAMSPTTPKRILPQARPFTARAAQRVVKRLEFRGEPAWPEVPAHADRPPSQLRRRDVTEAILKHLEDRKGLGLEETPQSPSLPWRVERVARFPAGMHILII